MKIHLETKRQAVHFLSGTFYAMVVWALPQIYALVILGVSAAFTFLFKDLIEKGFHIPLFSKLVRKTERVGKPAASGVTWFFLGSIFTLVVFNILFGVPKEFVVASMLVLAIGDSLTTGIGRKYGHKKLPRTETKSYKGTFAGFFGAFLGTSIVLSNILSFGHAIVIGYVGSMAGMLAEAYLTSVDDNLTIPIISCSAMVIAFVLINL